MRTTTGITDLIKIEISENNKPCSTPQMTAGGTLGRWTGRSWRQGNTCGRGEGG